jgi:hypothetical protein
MKNYSIWIRFRTDSGTGRASNLQQKNKRASDSDERFGSWKALFFALEIAQFHQNQEQPPNIGRVKIILRHLF